MKTTSPCHQTTEEAAHSFYLTYDEGISSCRLIGVLIRLQWLNWTRSWEVFFNLKTMYLSYWSFITGGELFDKIVNHGRMHEAEAKKYFQQLINTVDYFRSRGV